MKVDINKKYRTKSGKPVVLKRYDSRNPTKPIVGSILLPNGELSRDTRWTANGNWWSDSKEDSWDLVEVALKEVPLVPDPVDLTKIDVPFGELDELTQLKLKVAYYEGASIEVYYQNTDRWVTLKMMNPTWNQVLKYRVKPEGVQDGN